MTKSIDGFDCSKILVFFHGIDGSINLSIPSEPMGNKEKWEWLRIKKDSCNNLNYDMIYTMDISRLNWHGYATPAILIRGLLHVPL